MVRFGRCILVNINGFMIAVGLVYVYCLCLLLLEMYSIVDTMQ